MATLDKVAEARITARLDRMSAGNFGDIKPVGQGVFEMRIDYGPGYRVYFGRIGKACVLLFCAGDKRSQKADIAKAHEYFAEFKKRSAKK